MLSNSQFVNASNFLGCTEPRDKPLPGALLDQFPTITMGDFWRTFSKANYHALLEADMSAEIMLFRLRQGDAISTEKLAADASRKYHQLTGTAFIASACVGIEISNAVVRLLAEANGDPFLMDGLRLDRRYKTIPLIYGPQLVPQEVVTLGLHLVLPWPETRKKALTVLQGIGFSEFAETHLMKLRLILADCLVGQGWARTSQDVGKEERAVILAAVGMQVPGT